MADISDVKLELFPQNNLAQISYTVTGSNHDGEQMLAYRELVEIVGVDKRAHEDGKDDTLFSKEYRTAFDTSHIGFVQSREIDLSGVNLDEDPGIFRPDEIRARVTLIPEIQVSRESNLVTLFVNAQV